MILKSSEIYGFLAKTLLFLDCLYNKVESYIFHYEKSMQTNCFGVFSVLLLFSVIVKTIVTRIVYKTLSKLLFSEIWHDYVRSLKYFLQLKIVFSGLPSSSLRRDRWRNNWNIFCFFYFSPVLQFPHHTILHEQFHTRSQTKSKKSSR